MTYLTIGEVDFSVWGIIIVILIYLTMSAGALIIIPRRAVPYPTPSPTFRNDDPNQSSSPLLGVNDDLDTRSKVIELRGKVRATVMQFCVGVGVIFTIITTIQGIRKTEDEFKTAKANLFSSAIATIFNEASTPSQRIEKLHTLSFLSRSDPSYYRAIFEALSDFVRNPSAALCAYDDWHLAANAAPPREVLVAMQIFRTRSVYDGAKSTRFNFENACLIGFDARDDDGTLTGLKGVRLANAVIVASDFTNANLAEADLSDIRAGDFLSPKWVGNSKLLTYIPASDDKRYGDNDQGDLARKQTVARFSNANLTRANLSRANLAGADFSDANLADAAFDYANIARANFQGAKNIPFEKFRSLCVGQPDFTDDQVAAEQPFFSAEDRKRIGAISRCGAGIGH